MVRPIFRSLVSSVTCCCLRILSSKMCYLPSSGQLSLMQFGFPIRNHLIKLTGICHTEKMHLSPWAQMTHTHTNHNTWEVEHTAYIIWKSVVRHCGMPEWIVCYIYIFIFQELQQPLAILREAQSSLQRDCWRPPDPGNEKERCQDNHFNLGKLIIHWIECMCRGCACHFCLMLMLDHLSQAGICNSSREERAMFANQPCVHLEWLWSISMCSSMKNVFFHSMSHESFLTAREGICLSNVRPNFYDDSLELPPSQ